MTDKLVLVSDIHGNGPALEEVVKTESTDASYIFLGDLMGLCSYPVSVVQSIKTVDGRVLRGNHDKAIFEYGEGHVNDECLSDFEVSHTLEMLNDQDVSWMQSLPYMDVFTQSGAKVCACHAIPWPEKASGYEAGNAGIKKRDVPHFASIVAADYDYVFHGHTHQQFDLDANQWGHDVHFVNPGSLGYNGTYSVIDMDSGEVEHKSVEIPWNDVKSHVQAVLPDDCPHVENWL